MYIHMCVFVYGFTCLCAIFVCGKNLLRIISSNYIGFWFISRPVEKWQPFFKLLRRRENYEWTPECEEAFQELKKFLASALLLAKLLAKPVPQKELLLYLSISPTTVSSTVVWKEDWVQQPVYYINLVLKDAETRYTKIEKLSLTLVSGARKLAPYNKHIISWSSSTTLIKRRQRPYTYQAGWPNGVLCWVNMESASDLT